MWLSKKTAVNQENTTPDIGRVTIAGSDLGVYAKSERRKVRLFAPKGYFWKPARDQKLLVIDLQDGSRAAIAMEAADIPHSLQPGEVYISSDFESAIYLKKDGNISIVGDVNIEGSLSVNGITIA